MKLLFALVAQIACASPQTIAQLAEAVGVRVPREPCDASDYQVFYDQLAEAVPSARADVIAENQGVLVAFAEDIESFLSRWKHTVNKNEDDSYFKPSEVFKLDAVDWEVKGPALGKFVTAINRRLDRKNSAALLDLAKTIDRTKEIAAIRFPRSPRYLGPDDQI